MMLPSIHNLRDDLIIYLQFSQEFNVVEGSEMLQIFNNKINTSLSHGH